MKLSEAIRLGAMSTPHLRGQLRGPVAVARGSVSLFGRYETLTEYQEGTCAMGAALQAFPCGTKLVRAGDSDRIRGAGHDDPEKMVEVIAAPDSWQVVLGRMQCCPACAPAGAPMVTVRLIAHLNDDHLWSRELIADWVEKTEQQIEAEAAIPPFEVLEVG